MHKFSLFAAVILLVSVLAGCANSTPGGDTVPADLSYTGTFLDLVAEEERTEQPENGELKITKVDKETGWGVVPGMSAGDVEFLYPRMDYDGNRYQLRFENSLLTGYITLDAENMVPPDTEEDSYKTDMEKLSELFNEYVRQVNVLIESGEAEG